MSRVARALRVLVLGLAAGASLATMSAEEPVFELLDEVVVPFALEQDAASPWEIGVSLDGRVPPGVGEPGPRPRGAGRLVGVRGEALATTGEVRLAVYVDGVADVEAGQGSDAAALDVWVEA